MFILGQLDIQLSYIKECPPLFSKYNITQTKQIHRKRSRIVYFRPLGVIGWSSGKGLWYKMVSPVREKTAVPSFQPWANGSWTY